MSPVPTRVLVVDDEQFLRKELVAMLQEEGLDVVGEAGNGQLGVELAGLLAPDVVLMDLRMPGMNGIDACRAICQAANAPAVVLLSAYDDATLKQSAAEVGAFDYLIKGCRAEFVLGVVQLAATQGRAR
jgi:response regulator NasT